MPMSAKVSWPAGRSAIAAALIVLATVGGWIYFSSSTTSRSAEPDALARVLSSNELRAGYVVVPPWIIKDPNTGELSGSSVGAIREIGRLANLNIRFVEANWGTFVSGLQTGQFDVSIVPSYITVGRARAVNFTRPISYSGNSVLVRADETRFARLNDLDQQGNTIVVVQGTQDHEFATRNFSKATVRPIPTQDISLLFVEVVNRRADAALADAYNIGNFVRINAAAKDLLPGSPYNILPASWAVRYGDNALWQFLNNSLVNLEGNGTLAHLDRRYQVPNDRPF